MLDEAVTRLARWRQAVAEPAGAPAQDAVTMLRAHLADDLDTAGALAAVDGWVTETLTRRGRDIDAPALLTTAVDALLGIAL
jgi:L-cysteine:1D-myo-inositol 2-amino-2-deoxy-alpha-D-glucopyranoside ligase